MELIENTAKLTSVFGKWPSFHDAEVLRLVLDRAGEKGPVLEVDIHVFEMTSEVDPTGHYVHKNHTLVSLTFTEVAIEQLRGFNRQNVLRSLELSEIDPAVNDGRRLKIDMPSSYGLEASFQCKRAIVTDAKPYHAAA